MSMSSIIGRITIWIGIVAQIYFSVVFVRMISINIAGGSDYETIFLLGLILTLFTVLPTIFTAIYMESYSVIGGALFIVYAIIALCLYNFLSAILWLIGGILLIWNKYSKDESTDENEKVDIESTENQFESKDKITKE
ncbi:putative membrane protein [Staphylococcus aureus subsp. aureus HO 5096 0412]|nr:putative membrane protein [Staphylococcus aureus subsp. aureus HO 5096 0412]